jgi:hypothetical protein
MKRKLAIKENRPLADFLPTITITAKQLATEITNFNVHKNDLNGEKKKQEERDMLKGHLSEVEFFNTGEFNEVKVNGYKDGKLSSVLTVLAKEMKQDIPVKISNDGSKFTITGTFDVDFKELGIEGLAVNEKKP